METKKKEKEKISWYSALPNCCCHRNIVIRFLYSIGSIVLTLLSQKLIFTLKALQ